MEILLEYPKEISEKVIPEIGFRMKLIKLISSIRESKEAEKNSLGSMDEINTIHSRVWPYA